MIRFGHVGPGISLPRLRIAVLLDNLNAFSGGYEAQLRDAIHAKCRELGHHLLLVYGGPVEAPEPVDAADNAIHELLRPDSADGIIVVSSLLSTYCGPDGVVRLVERFARAPMCSIGIELPGIPSLVLDNRPGHGGGDRAPHPRARLPQDRLPRGNAEEPGGRGSLRGLPGGAGASRPPVRSGPDRPRSFPHQLGQGGHGGDPRARVAIDAVVAANDEMATGALDVLRKHGLRVPQDVSVTGFDDLMLARLGNPPLTTVAQPFEEVADWAVRAIEAQIAGRTVPARTQVAARFVRRQSCGCGFGAYRRDSQPLALGVRRAGPRARTGDDGRSPRIAVARAGRDARHRLLGRRAAATRLLDGLRAELGGQAEAFHAAVTGLLDNAGTDNERQRMLHSAICYLRDELRGWSNLQVERVLFEGLNLVALSNATSQMQHRLLLDENYLRLLGVGEQASIAFDLASLRRALVKGLPSAGVTSAYLACVAGPDRGVLRSAMCLRDSELVEGDGVEYPAHQLFPPGALTDDRRETS